MAKRALVIGAQTGELTGVEGDALRVAAALTARGFVCDVRTAERATRAGILAGYRALIADTQADDAAVLYYSGHGTCSVNLDAIAPPRTLQNIVPTDHDRSTADDFRGITAQELSILQHRLTAKTRNVTVILDCCHSAQMSRDSAKQDAMARALPSPLALNLAPHLAALDRLYPGELAGLERDGNPDAVRLVACAQAESAYEYTNPTTGVRTGAFTEALLQLLDDTRAIPISWALLGLALRQRVSQRFASQRPDFEGPTNRMVFATEELPGDGVVPVTQRGARYEIGAGAIHGVAPGDTYKIVSLKARELPIARAEVERTRPTTADLKLSATAPAPALPDDAVAIPLTRAAIKRPVVVAAGDSERAAVEAAFKRIQTLRIAEADDAPRSLATLRIADGQLTIEDAHGPLFAPASYPASLDPAVQNLANLGVAQALRELVGAKGVFARELDIEWGVVEDGALHPRDDDGVALGLGDRIYCKVTSKARRRLHVHIFNIGLRGKVTYLTPYAPSGVALANGESLNLAELPDGSIAGLELSWPDGLPAATFPRVDSLLVIATTAPSNLRVLETQTATMRGARAMGTSDLEQLLSQVQHGGTRDAKLPGQIEGYYAKLMTYHLHAREGRMTSPDFLVDCNRSSQAAGRASSAWIAPSSGAPPRAIAIRLAELVIHDNHAWFATDVRIDTLIVTRAPPGVPSYRVETVPGKDVRDGDRLAVENALLYHGPVRDFVDVSLWVSRDPTGSQTLADLIAARVGTPEVKDAAGALLVAAGVAAPWIAAVGASAVIARVAYDAILAASNHQTIGLFRTSFLASEGYGVGRYPPEDMYRAQGLSFVLRIDEVPEPTP